MFAIIITFQKFIKLGDRTYYSECESFPAGVNEFNLKLVRTRSDRNDTRLDWFVFVTLTELVDICRRVRCYFRNVQLSEE